MRISDWSSDVCSSDLVLQRVAADVAGEADHRLGDVAEQVQAAVDDVAEGIAGVADQDARAIERAAGEPATGEQDRVAAQHRAGGIEQAIGAVADVGNQVAGVVAEDIERSEEHTSELQSLMRNSYAVFCLQTKQ